MRDFEGRVSRPYSATRFDFSLRHLPKPEPLVWVSHSFFLPQLVLCRLPPKPTWPGGKESLKVDLNRSCAHFHYIPPSQTGFEFAWNIPEGPDSSRGLFFFFVKLAFYETLMFTLMIHSTDQFGCTSLKNKINTTTLGWSEGNRM